MSNWFHYDHHGLCVTQGLLDSPFEFINVPSCHQTIAVPERARTVTTVMLAYREPHSDVLPIWLSTQVGLRCLVSELRVRKHCAEKAASLMVDPVTHDIIATEVSL